MATKSKILFIGGTGYIGKFMVEASAKAGHPTSVLVRESTLSNPAKSNVIGNYKNLGVNFLIPGATAPPRDKVIILGDGNPKAVFNKEDDIATYTIKAVDDPRTLNKILYIKPPANTISFNDLVSLWEKKIGKTLERIYVPEEQLLKNIQEAPVPVNVILAINHSAFVKGDHTNFEIEPSFGVEASELYPDVKYTTVDEYLNQLDQTIEVSKFYPTKGDKIGQESREQRPLFISFSVRKGMNMKDIKTFNGRCEFVDGYRATLIGEGESKKDLIRFTVIGGGKVRKDGLAVLNVLKESYSLVNLCAPVFNKEDDIATYTIRAVDDPRTLNKILYIKPRANIISFNDLVSLWEKKIGKTLERIYVPEEKLLKNIEEDSAPLDVVLSIGHSAFVKGAQINFEIEPNRR
ncbi:unnamed protein product [Dovyalis caffra]|uniref:NmrA-like domain-containing protein n=1 Tax=Dovyalis caffra TaxID=77055 RepID=A0AAV1RBE7_9ROSI|nr:unnamed protein product [Dovyalis caffra]